MYYRAILESFAWKAQVMYETQLTKRYYILTIINFFKGDSCSLGHIKSTLIVEGVFEPYNLLVGYKIALLLIYLYGAASDNDLHVVV